jgi:hypothetical protein
MGLLAIHAEQINEKKDLITEVLVHFDTILEADSKELSKVSAAADSAFPDDLLFEKFRYWMDDRNDEILLFHINAFFEDRPLKVLSSTERDFTSRRDTIETNIEKDMRERQKKIFIERFSKLATHHKLNTNIKIANFLEMDVEQVRRYIVGENKPQRATLIKIADKFGVSAEYLSGFKDTP